MEAEKKKSVEIKFLFALNIIPWFKIHAGYQMMNQISIILLVIQFIINFILPAQEYSLISICLFCFYIWATYYSDSFWVKYYVWVIQTISCLLNLVEFIILIFLKIILGNPSNNKNIFPQLQTPYIKFLLKSLTKNFLSYLLVLCISLFLNYLNYNWLKYTSVRIENSLINLNLAKYTTEHKVKFIPPNQLEIKTLMTFHDLRFAEVMEKELN